MGGTQAQVESLLKETTKENNEFKQCEKCKAWLNDERDLIMHMTTTHIHQDPGNKAVIHTLASSTFSKSGSESEI